MLVPNRLAVRGACVYEPSGPEFDSLRARRFWTVYEAISPWLNPLVADQVKRALWSIQDCRELDIVRSTLVRNKEWKELGWSAP